MKKFWKSDKDKADKDTSAPPSDNPYAQQGNQPDPYSSGQPDPMKAGGYQRGGLPSGPRPGGGGLPGRPSPRPGGGGSGGYASPAPTGGSGYGSPAPSMSSGAGGYPPSNTSKYAASSGGGYGSDKYGAQSGYGSDRYGSGRPQGGGGARGPGGYGGMGGMSGGNANDDDGDRDALFGAKKQAAPGGDNRYRQPAAAPAPANSYGSYGSSGGRNQDPSRDALFGGARERIDAREQNERDRLYGGGTSAVDGGSYGGYGEERELTEEEKQEMQIRGVVDKTRQVRQEDIDSLARTEALGLQSLEIVQGSIARLGHQNDRLAMAERNLDKAIAQNEETRVHVNDLKRINNGGMLSSLAKNPFAKGKRASEREAAAVRRREEATEMQEETKRGQIAMNSQTQRIVGSIQQRRNKYEYEDDDDNIGRDELDQTYLGEGAEDDDYAQESQIERKLRSIEYISNGLNDASKQLNKYIDDSAPQLERTAKKAERADIGIARNHATIKNVR